MDYPQNFIIFRPQKLKIKFKQVCMHLKTHFKVLFNSSKISKTCAHIIFLLNTRHDQELNKIETITFGSTKLELSNLQNWIQNWRKWTSFFLYCHWYPGPTEQKGPHVMDTKTEHGEGRRWDDDSSPTAKLPAKLTPPWCSPHHPAPIEVHG